MLQRHGKKSRGSAAYRICGKKGAVQQVSVFFEEDQHPHGACGVYCGIGTGTGTDFRRRCRRISGKSGRSGNADPPVPSGSDLYSAKARGTAFFHAEICGSVH